MTRAEDKAMLDLAARVAYRATGHVEPNPLVGCVVCRPGSGAMADRVIGIGHHRRFGGVHAEVDALDACRRLGNDPAGATVYVTLEPCGAAGKQPACVDALIRARVAEVVVARADPHPVKGGGATLLRTAGIGVRFCDASANAIRLADPFVKRVATGLPWVIGKWAQTIDGKLASLDGDSKWISNERSRRRVHQLRGRIDGILVGGGTMIKDAPRLTPRGVPIRRTLRRFVLADPVGFSVDGERAIEALDADRAKFPWTMIVEGPSARYGQSVINAWRARGVDVAESPALFSGEVQDMHENLRWLGSTFGVHTLMVEGGPLTLTKFLARGVADELQVYISPRFMGDGLGPIAFSPRGEPLDSSTRYTLIDQRSIGDDARLVYRCETRS